MPAVLLDGLLEVGVDHGPQGSSIAAPVWQRPAGSVGTMCARPAQKMLGDVRGGAGEKCADLHPDIAARHDWGASLDAATRDGCANWLETHGTIVSGAVSMDRSIRAHFG